MGGGFGTPIISWFFNSILEVDMPEIVAAEIAIALAFIVAWFVKDRLPDFYR